MYSPIDQIQNKFFTEAATKTSLEERQQLRRNYLNYLYKTVLQLTAVQGPLAVTFLNALDLAIENMLSFQLGDEDPQAFIIYESSIAAMYFAKAYIPMVQYVYPNPIDENAWPFLLMLAQFDQTPHAKKPHHYCEPLLSIACIQMWALGYINPGKLQNYLEQVKYLLGQPLESDELVFIIDKVRMFIDVLQSSPNTKDRKRYSSILEEAQILSDPIKVIKAEHLYEEKELGELIVVERLSDSEDDNIAEVHEVEAEGEESNVPVLVQPLNPFNGFIPVKNDEKSNDVPETSKKIKEYIIEQRQEPKPSTQEKDKKQPPPS